MSDTQGQIFPIDPEVRGDRVMALMWQRRIRSVSALSRLMQIDRALLSKKLTGERDWYLREIRSLAHVLDTSTAYLIGDSDSPTPVNAKTAEGFSTVSAGGASFVAGAGYDPATSRL